jgi:hypothetical protein
MRSVSTRKSGLRAVLDSNILARFLLTPRGFSGRLLGILETGGFTLVTCEAILTEVIDVLARPHVQRYGPYPPHEIVEAVDALRGVAEVVPGRYEVADDPKDNPVLACALEGHADFVVTDDRKHLLPLKHYHGIQIVSMPLFLRTLGA